MYSRLRLTVQFVSAASAWVATKPMVSVALRAIKAVISFADVSIENGRTKCWMTYKLHHGTDLSTLLLLIPRNGLTAQ